MVKLKSNSLSVVFVLASVVLGQAAWGAQPSKVNGTAGKPSVAAKKSTSYILKTSVSLDTRQDDPMFSDGSMPDMRVYHSNMKDLETLSESNYRSGAGHFAVMAASSGGQIPRTYTLWGPDRVTTGRSVTFIKMGKLPFTSVVTAPEKGYNLDISENTKSICKDVGPEDLVVFRVKEAGKPTLYGKIKFSMIGYPLTMFDYLFQKDGTRNLDIED